MKLKNIKNREGGAVSMLTVIFFVLFLSVMSVGFVRIVNDERQRSLKNELSASALAAAEAGTEDAKRILLYCMNNAGGGDEACNGLNQKDDCDTLLTTFGENGVINTAGGEGGAIEGVVDSAGSKYQQYYTCMFIDQYTSDVEIVSTAADTKSAIGTASTIIPFDIVDTNSYTHPSDIVSFDLNWHLISDDLQNGDGPKIDQGDMQNDSNNYTKEQHKGPAVVRIEMVKVPKAGFTSGSLVDNTYAVTLRPVKDDVSGSVTEVTLFDYKPDTNAVPGVVTPPIQNVKCNNESNYQCSITIKYDGANIDVSANDYYLKITSYYRDTYVNIGNIVNGSGEQYKFNNVQPLIDVTGRVDNTLRRVITRVSTNASLAGGVFFPDFAIESSTTICKEMRIYSDYGTDRCEY